MWDDIKELLHLIPGAQFREELKCFQFLWLLLSYFHHDLCLQCWLVSMRVSLSNFCPQTILGRAQMLLLCFQFLLSLPLAPVRCPNSIMIRGPHRAAGESPFLRTGKAHFETHGCAVSLALQSVRFISRLVEIKQI